MDRRVVSGRRVMAEEGGEDILNSAVEKILVLEEFGVQQST